MKTDMSHEGTTVDAALEPEESRAIIWVGRRSAVIMWTAKDAATQRMIRRINKVRL